MCSGRVTTEQEIYITTPPPKKAWGAHSVKFTILSNMTYIITNPNGKKPLVYVVDPPYYQTLTFY